MIVDSKIDSLLCREHDVANQGFATLPTSLRILSSHVAVAAPGPDLVAILRRKQLVLDALTSDMGMTPDLRCFSLSPGHVERGLCGTLTVRSASERSFYSAHKLRMTKPSETQSYTILRISSCNFEPIKAISKGVSYHFSNTATGPVLLVPFSLHALKSFRTNWRPYFLRRVAVIPYMSTDCSHATKTRTLASSNLLICSDVISN